MASNVWSGVDESMDEELVHELTSSSLFQQSGSRRRAGFLKPMFDEGFMYSEFPIPLHLGAESVSHREQGLIP